MGYVRRDSGQTIHARAQGDTSRQGTCYRMTPKKCLVSIIVVVAWAWPSLSGGQVSRSLSRALPLGDALGLRFLGPYSPVVLSPDGTMLAYTIIDRQETRHFELDAWARTGVPWYGEGAQTCVLNLK